MRGGLVFLCSIVIGFSAQGNPKASAPKRAAGSATVCAPRALKLKNCYLDLDKNKIHIWQDKIFLKDQIHRDLEPISLGANLVEWSLVRVVKKKNRGLLELALWSPPVGAGDVETLVWTLYEVENGALKKKLEKIIRRRKRTETKGYKYDKMIPHEIRVRQNQVVWRVGREEGNL